MTRSMIDAAWPPSQPPKVDAVAFYIGGGTPHVWTATELADTMRKAGATRRLPIFVRVPPTTHDADADADFCIRWAQAHGQPKGTMIALDYETAIDPWWFGFDRRVQAAGYKTLLYGTLRTVVQNVIYLPDGSSRHPSGGYWSAHWTNTPHICPNPYVTATQYGGDVTLGQPWDISLVTDSVPLWGGAPAQEDLSIVDADTKAYLDDFRQQVQHGFVLVLRGDDTHTDNLDSIHADTQKLLAGGVTVKLDLSQATPQQIQDLATAIANGLVVKGVGYSGTVDLSPKPAV